MGDFATNPIQSCIRRLGSLCLRLPKLRLLVEVFRLVGLMIRWMHGDSRVWRIGVIGLLLLPTCVQPNDSWANKPCLVVRLRHPSDSGFSLSIFSVSGRCYNKLILRVSRFCLLGCCGPAETLASLWKSCQNTPVELKDAYNNNTQANPEIFIVTSGLTAYGLSFESPSR